MEVATMAVNPAAGPETPTDEPEKIPTTIPPQIPAMSPENTGASLAKAIPRQSGTATKKTTTPAGMSCFQEEKNDFIKTVL